MHTLTLCLALAVAALGVLPGRAEAQRAPMPELRVRPDRFVLPDSVERQRIPPDSILAWLMTPRAGSRLAQAGTCPMPVAVPGDPPAVPIPRARLRDEAVAIPTDRTACRNPLWRERLPSSPPGHHR